MWARQIKTRADGPAFLIATYKDLEVKTLVFKAVRYEGLDGGQYGFKALWTTSYDMTFFEEVVVTSKITD